MKSDIEVEVESSLEKLNHLLLPLNINTVILKSKLDKLTSLT